MEVYATFRYGDDVGCSGGVAVARGRRSTCSRRFPGDGGLVCRSSGVAARHASVVSRSLRADRGSAAADERTEKWARLASRTRAQLCEFNQTTSRDEIRRPAGRYNELITAAICNRPSDRPSVSARQRARDTTRESCVVAPTRDLRRRIARAICAGSCSRR